jgi:hypothetical protein
MPLQHPAQLHQQQRAELQPVNKLMQDHRFHRVHQHGLPVVALRPKLLPLRYEQPMFRSLTSRAQHSLATLTRHPVQQWNEMRHPLHLGQSPRIADRLKSISEHPKSQPMSARVVDPAEGNLKWPLRRKVRPLRVVLHRARQVLQRLHL